MFMVTYWYDRDSYGTSTSHRDRLNKCSFFVCGPETSTHSLT